MTESLVPMMKAMRVVGLLKREIEQRKAGYRIMDHAYDDLHDDFVDALKQLSGMLRYEDVNEALGFIDEKLDEID